MYIFNGNTYTYVPRDMHKSIYNNTIFKRWKLETSQIYINDRMVYESLYS